MAKRPKISVKRISRSQVKGYEYVQPNPGVRAIAAINGKGAYVRGNSARSRMESLSANQRRERAAEAVRNAITRPRRTNQGKNDMRRRRMRKNRKSAWAGTKKVTVRIPRSNAHQSRYSYKGRTGASHTRPVTFRVPSDEPTPIELLAKNRRKRRKSSAKSRRRVVKNRRRVVKNRRRVVKNRRRVVNRRRRVVKNRRRRSSAKRRTSKRRLKMNRRRSSAKRRTSSRRLKSNRRRASKRMASNRRRTTKRRKSGSRKGFLHKNAGITSWLRVGALVTSGVIGHKLLTGFLKNALVPVDVTKKPILPEKMIPYAGILSGGVVAAAGVFATIKLVKDTETRQMVAGGMLASFFHTCIVELMKKSESTAKYAGYISGLGNDGYAARLSAMYGVGASIEPMYAPIGEYFSSGVNGLGALPPYAAAAGTGEYFSSGVGEYFSSGLGEYGSNPDMMQAAAGYGAVDAGTNTNHLDPSSNLDRELSIAEAAAGVGSVMQAAAGLGNVATVGASQTWIPGESDPQIWAGVRPVDRSQMSTAMIPAGTLQSGGGQGIFG